MSHVVTSTCVNDASCIPVCPVDAIHPRPDEAGFAAAEMLYIDPITCIDCAACLRACPVGAIRHDDDGRTDTAAMAELNAAYFLGAPARACVPRGWDA